MLFHLGTAAQLALFAVYAMLAVMVGRRFYANHAPENDEHRINDPAGRLVGKMVTVVADVDDHQGRVRVGDSEWSARGGPAEAGRGDGSGEGQNRAGNPAPTGLLVG